MAVKIRLKRMGMKGKPFYRIVVADSRTPRDGRFVEEIGYYNPVTDPAEVKVNVERASYWVKNGAIDRPVRGATLIGKGAQVLLDIDRVGKRMWLAQGMCGSKSGSVPTSVGQPMIRVTAMTVGGR